MTLLYHFSRSLSSGAVQVVHELNAPVPIRTLGFENGQFTCAENPALALPTGGMGLIGPVRSCPTYEEDVDGTRLRLIQCSAIIERLCDRFDPNDTLRPPANSSARARHLSLMVFAEATFFPIVQFLAAADSPHDNAREQMRRARFAGLVAPYLIEELDGKPYLFGDKVSACDFLMGMPCLNNAAGAGVLEPFPELTAYFERLRARESFVVARGDPADEKLNAALQTMAKTGHTDGWDFTFRAPHE